MKPKLHDRLVGYAGVAKNNHGEIYLIHEPLKANRFALSSMGERHDRGSFPETSNQQLDGPIK
jgi:hypothetical protein